ALVSGDVAAVFSAMPSLTGFVKDGRLKLIAVNTEKRSSLAPQIPTVAEFGLPGFEYSPHIGFSGPAGMPSAIVQKISKDVADVVKSPAMAERMATLGIDPVGSTPQAYAAQHNAARERHARPSGGIRGGASRRAPRDPRRRGSAPGDRAPSRSRAPHRSRRHRHFAGHRPTRRPGLIRHSRRRSATLFSTREFARRMF